MLIRCEFAGKSKSALHVFPSRFFIIRNIWFSELFTKDSGHGARSVGGQKKTLSQTWKTAERSIGPADSNERPRSKLYAGSGNSQLTFRLKNIIISLDGEEMLPAAAGKVAAEIIKSN